MAPSAPPAPEPGIHAPSRFVHCPRDLAYGAQPVIDSTLAQTPRPRTSG